MKFLKKFRFIPVIAALIMCFSALTACEVSYNDIIKDVYNDTYVDEYDERDPLPDRIIVNDYSVGVGESVNLSAWVSEGVVKALGGAQPAVTFAVTGAGESMALDAVRIDGGAAYGVRGGNSVTVTASLTAGGKTYTDTFGITCTGSEYVAREDEDSWFNPIESLGGGRTAFLAADRDFALGTDISMVQQVLDMGGKYYGADGREASVYQIMKDYGVNTVRIRLWVDPFYYEYEGAPTDDYREYDDPDGITLKSPYGGGICDTETATKMAVDATNAGLDVMICTHYSDYWSTSNETIPKPWYRKILNGEVTVAGTVSTDGETGISTASDASMAKVIMEYTHDTLKYMTDAGAKIKYWQLGNENLGGILHKAPKAVTKGAVGAGDTYNQGKTFTGGESFVRGSGATFTNYLKAMIGGIKNLYIERGEERYTKTILHSANVGGADTFKSMITGGVDYVIMGISAYIQYSHGMPATLKGNNFNGLGNDSDLAGKGLMIVETSYAYTVKSAKYASNTFQAGNANTYPVSVVGQAQNLWDTIDALAAMPRGAGVITWEGAWLPVKGAGWSDITTSASSWSTQAFFSYDGKVLPSLAVFRDVRLSA
jgi:arabinogalactan endo-1,4-beta-galactosidase